MNKSDFLGPRIAAALGCAGGVLALAAAIAFSYFSIKTLGDLREQIAYDKFKTALTNTNYFSSRQRLDDLLTNLKIYRWQQSFLRSAAETPPAEKEDAIIELHNIISKLDQGNFEVAQQKFNALRDGKLKEFLWHMPRSRESSALLSETQKRFEQYQAKLLELRQKEVSVPEQVKSNGSAVMHGQLLMHALLQELREFFSLAPEDGILPEKAESFEHYTEGVLSELPTMPELEDGIPDLVALKGALAKAGGTVKLKGQDAPALFQTRLKELKERSRAIQTELAAAEANTTTLEGDLASARKELFALGKALEGRLKELLLAVSNPRANEDT
jgi:hypothetical protein